MNKPRSLKMRSELLELERQEAAELMGYDAWAAM